mmetsp:Transcript_13903/g.24624  ORF Transcript_13903/g.24624 Transcript_13903/m.24624 type:complete len:365 (+) Transcript_13903:262-1356(+)
MPSWLRRNIYNSIISSRLITTGVFVTIVVVLLFSQQLPFLCIFYLVKINYVLCHGLYQAHFSLFPSYRIFLCSLSRLPVNPGLLEGGEKVRAGPRGAPRRRAEVPGRQRLGRAAGLVPQQLLRSLQLAGKDRVKLDIIVISAKRIGKFKGQVEEGKEAHDGEHVDDQEQRKGGVRGVLVVGKEAQGQQVEVQQHAEEVVVRERDGLKAFVKLDSTVHSSEFDNCSRGFGLLVGHHVRAVVVPLQLDDLHGVSVCLSQRPLQAKQVALARVTLHNIQLLLGEQAAAVHQQLVPEREGQARQLVVEQVVRRVAQPHHRLRALRRGSEGRLGDHRQLLDLPPRADHVFQLPAVPIVALLQEEHQQKS